MSRSAVRKGDTVLIMTGKERGKRGKILQVFSEGDRVLIEKLNLVKKHVRPSRSSKGGIVEKEGAIARAKVMLVCPSCDKPTRIAVQTLPDGSRLRRCKRCEQTIDKS